MKRLCTEEERKLLYQNKGQMLQGINWTAARSKLGQVLEGIFLSAFLAIGATVLIAYCVSLSKIPLLIVMFILMAVFYIIYFVITSNLNVKKETKAFLKQQNLMVNGATIVAADGEKWFAYIEDDFVDESGKPIIIEYPAAIGEMSKADVGKRILVMYDGDSRFQLVKLNEELKRLIPEYATGYPLTEAMDTYQSIPHPKLACIEKEGHELSEGEKVSFAKLYVKVVQSVSTQMLKKATIALVFIAIVLCVLLNYAEGGYPLSQTVPIAAAFCVGFPIFLLLVAQLGKVNLRRQAQFVHVKEVVFHSYIVGQNQMTVHVYEWIDGQVRVCEYSAGNVATNTPYGSVLYKFMNQKGEVVLLNTCPVGKKQK